MHVYIVCLVPCLSLRGHTHIDDEPFLGLCSTSACIPLLMCGVGGMGDQVCGYILTGSAVSTRYVSSSSVPSVCVCVCVRAREMWKQVEF